MAIVTGAGPHLAWLTVNGATFPIEHGSVEQNAKRKSSTFSASIPLSYPGAYDTLATIGDNTCTIGVLTRGMSATLFTGEIDDVDCDLIRRIIRVTGRDKSAKLHENKTSEKWVNKKTTDVVQDLIGRVGLSGNISAAGILAGKKLEQDFVKISDNVSFAYIIHKLAELDGARWFVDANGRFNYVPFNASSGIYSITINQHARQIFADCLHFNIKRNVQAGKTVVATVKSWHPKKKQVFEYKSTVPGSGGPVNYNYHLPNLMQDHVTSYARAQANHKVMHEMTVNTTVVGDPSVAAGMGLSVSGTDYFDQVYNIDHVHHSIGMQGHRTSIVARAPKQGRSAS